MIHKNRSRDIKLAWREGEGRNGHGGAIFWTVFIKIRLGLRIKNGLGLFMKNLNGKA